MSDARWLQTVKLRQRRWKEEARDSDRLVGNISVARDGDPGGSVGEKPIDLFKSEPEPETESGGSWAVGTKQLRSRHEAVSPGSLYIVSSLVPS